MLKAVHLDDIEHHYLIDFINAYKNHSYKEKKFNSESDLIRFLIIQGYERIFNDSIKEDTVSNISALNKSNAANILNMTESYQNNIVPQNYTESHDNKTLNFSEKNIKEKDIRENNINEINIKLLETNDKLNDQLLNNNNQLISILTETVNKLAQNQSNTSAISDLISLIKTATSTNSHPEENYNAFVKPPISNNFSSSAETNKLASYTNDINNSLKNTDLSNIKNDNTNITDSINNTDNVNNSYNNKYNDNDTDIDTSSLLANLLNNANR